MAPADQPKAAFEAQVPNCSISVCYRTPKWQLCTKNGAVPSWELPVLLSWSAASQCMVQQSPGHQQPGLGALPWKGITSPGISPCSLQTPCPSSICFPEDAISRPRDATSSFVLCRAWHSTAITGLTLASSCAWVRFSGPSSRLPCVQHKNHGARERISPWRAPGEGMAAALPSQAVMLCLLHSHHPWQGGDSPQGELPLPEPGRRESS